MDFEAFRPYKQRTYESSFDETIAITLKRDAGLATVIADTEGRLKMTAAHAIKSFSAR